MAIETKLSEQLKDVKEKQRSLKKKEKELKEHIAVEKDIVKWQKIMDLRADCVQLVLKADLGISMSLTKLDKYPDYYIYQHPVKKHLKTANRQAEWVKQYVGEVSLGNQGGVTGDLEDLITTARKSTIAAWKRMNKKAKRVTKVKLLKPKGTGKVRTGDTGIG